MCVIRAHWRRRCHIVCACVQSFGRSFPIDGHSCLSPCGHGQLFYAIKTGVATAAARRSAALVIVKPFMVNAKNRLNLIWWHCKCHESRTGGGRHADPRHGVCMGGCVWQIAIDFSITTISRLGIETCALLSRPMSLTDYHEISVGMVVAQSTVRTLSRRNQKGLLNENGKISKFSFKILLRPNLFTCSNTSRSRLRFIQVWLMS